MQNIIKYISTNRYTDGGSSTGNYANFNLATHTFDDQSLVQQNRHLLLKKYKLPSAPKFLEQTHSTICLDDFDDGNFADSIITRKKGVVCCVLTADCLPIFAYDNDVTIAGICHAGWQGLFDGVIENFINKFNINNNNLNIRFGAALSQNNFEVGIEFYQKFITKDTAFKNCFINVNGKYKFDIYYAAAIILQKLGVKNIIENNNCTFAEKDKYYSYRRDGEKSGRMAHLIWIE